MAKVPAGAGNDGNLHKEPLDAVGLSPTNGNGTDNNPAEHSSGDGSGAPATAPIAVANVQESVPTVVSGGPAADATVAIDTKLAQGQNDAHQAARTPALGQSTDASTTKPMAAVSASADGAPPKKRRSRLPKHATDILGAMVCTGSDDNTAKLWRTSNGELIRTLCAVGLNPAPSPDFPPGLDSSFSPPRGILPRMYFVICLSPAWQPASSTALVFDRRPSSTSSLSFSRLPQTLLDELPLTLLDELPLTLSLAPHPSRVHQ